MLVVYDAFCYFLVGTNIASNFLWANGIKLFKVREETVKLMGRGDIFLSPICPPLSEDAQKALDWALDEKLKSGNLLLMFSSCCGFPVSLKFLSAMCFSYFECEVFSWSSIKSELSKILYYEIKWFNSSFCYTRLSWIHNMLRIIIFGTKMFYKMESNGHHIYENLSSAMEIGTGTEFFSEDMFVSAAV